MNYPAAELRGIGKPQVLVTDSGDRAASCLVKRLLDPGKRAMLEDFFKTWS